MSKKTVKHSKTVVRKQRDIIIRSFLRAVYSFPLNERIKFAWAIVRRKYQ